MVVFRHFSFVISRDSAQHWEASRNRDKRRHGGCDVINEHHTSTHTVLVAKGAGGSFEVCQS